VPKEQWFIQVPDQNYHIQLIYNKLICGTQSISYSQRLDHFNGQETRTWYCLKPPPAQLTQSRCSHRTAALT
jgi:hypothetical protein